MSPTDNVGRKILLVDDDASVLQALEMALHSVGENVDACGSFDEGRAALRANAFDVLLTDVRLGAHNGIQLAVLARDAQPRIRIIVFSGFDDPVLRAEAASVGATYLVKPVTGRQIAQLLAAS